MIDDAIKMVGWYATVERGKEYGFMYDAPFSDGYSKYIGEEIAKKKTKQYLYAMFYGYKIKHIFEKVVFLKFIYIGYDPRYPEGKGGEIVIGEKS